MIYKNSAEFRLLPIIALIRWSDTICIRNQFKLFALQLDVVVFSFKSNCKRHLMCWPFVVYKFKQKPDNKSVKSLIFYEMIVFLRYLPICGTNFQKFLSVFVNSSWIERLCNVKLICLMYFTKWHRKKPCFCTWKFTVKRASLLHSEKYVKRGKEFAVYTCQFLITCCTS